MPTPVKTKRKAQAVPFKPWFTKQELQQMFNSREDKPQASCIKVPGTLDQIQALNPLFKAMVQIDTYSHDDFMELAERRNALFAQREALFNNVCNNIVTLN